MNNWKKLTLKKRRVEEDEQPRKVGDCKKAEHFGTNLGTSKHSTFWKAKSNNYGEKIKQSTFLDPNHRVESKSDEAKNQSERMLKSMALASLRKTGGYRSIFANRVKAEDHKNGYRRLPKPCYQCSLLQLEPVISIDNYGNEGSGRFFLDSTCSADQKLHKEEKRKLAGTITPSIIKENLEHLSQVKNHIPIKLDLDDMKQFRLKNVNRQEEDESYNCFGGISLKENEKSIAVLRSRDSVGQTENKKQMLRANNNCEDAGISDVDFDSEMNSILSDIPENGFVKEPCLHSKNKSAVRETFANNEKEAAFELVGCVPSKTIVKPKQFSCFSSECDTTEKDVGPSGKRSKSSAGLFDKTMSKKIGKNIPKMGNNTKRCNMPKVSRGKALSNGRENKLSDLKTPHRTIPCSYDVGRDKDCDDDDVIITKEIYKGKETIYGKNRNSQHRIVADSRNVNRKFYVLEGSSNSLNAVEKCSKTIEEIQQFSDNVKSTSSLTKRSSKHLQQNSGDCPMCQMKFPQWWKSDEKDHHISECLADDMFANEIDDS